MCVRETEVYLFLEFAVASSMIWNKVGLKLAKYSCSIEHGVMEIVSLMVDPLEIDRFLCDD